MSFLSPLFFLGVLALSVPIFVHLIRKERAKKVPFASLMFLRRIPQKSIRRRRLRHPLLLLLRCLAILLFVLSFTRPFLRSDAGIAGFGAKDKAAIILLDSSYSMGYGNRFEQAREKARSIIRSAGEKDKVGLIKFSQGYQILSQLTDNKANALASINQLAKPTSYATDYIQALRAANSLLAETGSSEKIIYLISDFQASGWNRAGEAFALNAGVKLIPVDVATESGTNLAVTEVSLDSTVYSNKYTGKLIAKINNPNEAGRRDLKVILRINDHVIEEKKASIAANSSQAVEFTDFHLLPGNNRGVIEIEADSLPVDDKFYFIINRGEQIKVLCVETAIRGPSSESFYLRQALRTGENIPYAVNIKTAGAVNPAEIKDQQIIFLNDVSNLGEAVISNLKAAVERGAGLVISLGRKTDAGQFNKAFEGVAPARLTTVETARGKDYFLLTSLKTDHPIFSPFADARSVNVAALRFYSYFNCEPSPRAAVLGRFDDGSPAFVEWQLGNGKVLLFTSSLDTSWNDMPLTPVYLPLIHQAAKYLLPQEGRAYYRVGEAIKIKKPGEDDFIAIDSPAEKRLTTSDEGVAQDGSLFTAQENGFYRIRYPGRAQFAAVNLDFKESDLSKLNLDDFVAAVTTRSDTTVAEGTEKMEKKTDEEIEAGQNIWWSLLILSLVLFGLEAVLANRVYSSKVIRT